MAQDEVVVIYKAVPEGFDKVNASVNSVTEETKELQAQIKATFADKSISQATTELIKQGEILEELVINYGSVSGAVKVVKKDLESLSVANKKDTEEYKAKFEILGSLQKKQQQLAKETKAAFSDTRTLDLVAQGIRGVAGAFQVGMGAVVLFGKENENLQKTLVKLNSAMALLTGVQELARIATEENGIATKAYGVALTVVDKISKITGLSMAASWALATGGITLVIGALTTLYFWFQKNQDASEELALQEKARKEKQDEIDSIIRANTSKANQLEYEQEKLLAKTKQESAEAEIRYNRGIATSLESKVKGLKGMIGAFKDSEKGTKEYNDANGLLLDTQLAYTATLQKIKDAEAGLSIDRKKEAARIKQTPIDNVTAYSLPDAPKDFTKNFLEGVQEDVNIQKAVEIPFKPVIPKKDMEDMVTEAIDAMSKLQPLINEFGNLSTAIFENQTAAINAEREKQLQQAGDDFKKREQIEKEFARKSAILRRNQAIQEKALGAVNIGINIAQAITKQLAATPLPAGAAFVALIAAQGAAQLAALLAKPIPEIPKFEKGGAVALAGGRIDNGYLIGRSHREGGILIEAQGKEYIWDEQTTAKHGDIIQAAHENRIEDLVMHKYVVPMMRQQQKNNSTESYDDMLLRSTIKSSNKQMSKEIVKGISKNMQDAIYLTSRYKS